MKFFTFCLLIVTLLSCTKDKTTTDSKNEYEVRGTWITNVDSDVLLSRESIAEAMKFLADHNFNLVCPVVWNKGVPLFKSEVMNQAFGITIDTIYGDRDPLKELIEEAHKNNLKVMAWFEYGFAASHKRDGGHIIQKKQHWAAKDNNGKLLTKNGFEWMNAYHPEVQQFMIDLVCEVVKKYDVDGVQGDDRLPAQPVEGGYSDYTINLYKSEHQGSEPPADFTDEKWKRWRADKLNNFAKALYDSVKAIKNDVLVTWSPSILPFAYDEYLQDWSSWVKGGYADQVFPQVYRYSLEEYTETMQKNIPEKIRGELNYQNIYPGILMNIANYRIDEEYLMGALKYNRKNDYKGEMYFFYEGLRQEDSILAKRLKETFYKEKAKFPSVK